MMRFVFVLLLALLPALAFGQKAERGAGQGEFNPRQHTPARDCGAPTNGTSDASTAINACVAAAIAGGWDLTIDQTYKCSAGCNLFQTGAVIRFVNGGKLIQGFSPTGAQAVCSQSSFGTPVSSVRIYDLECDGDATHTLSGNIISLNCDDCDIDIRQVNHFGGSSAGGRAVLVAGDRTTVHVHNLLDPYPNGGAGGVRQIGGTDTKIIVDHGTAGDDLCQQVVAASGTWANKDIIRSTFFYCDGKSITSRTFLQALVDPNTASGTVSMTASILDSGFISAKGGAGQNRGAVFENLNSSGHIRGSFAADLHVDAAGDYSKAQVVNITAGSCDTPVDDVYLSGLYVKEAWESSLSVSGCVKKVTIAGGRIGRAHMAQLDNVASDASAGATTATVTAASCALLKNGHSIGILLDDTAANGAYADSVQPFTLGADCSGTTLTLPSALLGSASAAFARLYDYSILPKPITVTVSSGATLTFQSVTGFTAGDAFRLVYDDGTSLATTISSLDATLNTVTLGASIAKSATAGNWAADTTAIGTVSPVVITGAYDVALLDMAIYGAGQDVISIGAGSTAVKYVHKGVFERLRLHDIAPTNYGINKHLCGGCSDRDVSFFPMAGVTTANAVAQNAAAPSWTTTLAAAITSTGAATMQLTDPTQFPYRGTFYALIDSEIVKVTPTRGAASATVTIARGQLGTTAATHSNSATVSVAQSSTVASPTIDADVTALAPANCASAIAYAPGMGNWVRDLNGCDAGFITLASASSIAYTDFAPIVRLTGNTPITGLTLTAPAPIVDWAGQFYESGASINTIANGSGFGNYAGATLTLSAKSLRPYVFDATTQTLRDGGKTATGTWTPTDCSGASLSFTSVSAAWSISDQLVTVYGTLTYPSTADGSNSCIAGLPVTVANANYAQPGVAAIVANNFFLQPQKNTAQLFIANAGGTRQINSALSAKNINFAVSYPAQ